MKTVRFQKLVEVAGKPEPYLVLVDPAKDRTLRAAVNANRVVTVYQPSAGARTDHGAVGFDPGTSRQFLVFPRGVGRFKGRRIVGIKYDLLGGESSVREGRGKSRDPKKRPRQTKGAKKYPPLRVLEKTEPATPAERGPSRSKKSRTPAAGGSASLARRKRAQVRLARAREERARKKKGEVEKQARAKARVLAALTAKVRKALGYLEAGKRAPAVKLLRRSLTAET